MSSTDAVNSAPAATAGRSLAVVVDSGSQVLSECSTAESPSFHTMQRIHPEPSFTYSEAEEAQHEAHEQHNERRTNQKKPLPVPHKEAEHLQPLASEPSAQFSTLASPFRAGSETSGFGLGASGQQSLLPLTSQPSVTASAFVPIARSSQSGDTAVHSGSSSYLVSSSSSLPARSPDLHEATPVVGTRPSLHASVPSPKAEGHVKQQ